MEDLREKLNKLIDELSADKRDVLRERLANLVSVYPFNEYEYILSSLMGLGKITLKDYQKIREEYIARNKYLELYTISSPTGFGITWAENHLKSLVPELVRPTKDTDKDYKVKNAIVVTIKEVFDLNKVSAVN